MIEDKRYSCPRYTCAICGKIRPNPEMCSDMGNMKEWEKNGEGWHILCDWSNHKRIYLCRECTMSVETWIDVAKRIAGRDYNEGKDN